MNYLIRALVIIVSSCVCIAQTEAKPLELLDVLSSPATPGSWQCTRPGRFSNPDDPSCRTYLTCIPDSDPGLFTLRQDECGPSSLFSGRYQRCITGSDCATLEDFYSIEYECYECGKFVLPGASDCRQFVNCLKTKDPGVFVPIKQSCPAGKLFSPEAHACVLEEEYECSVGTVQSTTTPKMVTNVSLPAAQVADATFSGGGHLSDFVCLSAGRFPDESVPHCRGYRWCTREGTEQQQGGRLVSRNFLCDAGQVFSETEAHCVSSKSYQCPDDDISADRFQCVSVGRFPDRSTGGCERYFHCQQTTIGTLKATLAQCPPGTVFSWLTTRCVPAAEYACPVATVTGETLAVVLPAVKQPDGKDETESNSRGRGLHHRSRCSSSGRFANDADAHCRTYFICTRDARGAWARVLVGCPAGTVFSRTASQCVGSETALSCSKVVASTTVQSMLEIDVDSQEVPIAHEDDSEEELECKDPEILLPNLTDRTCRTTSKSIDERVSHQDGPGEDEGGSFSYFGPAPEYPCTATGRFADINSVDCRSYFLCKLQQPSGSFLSVHLTCPDGMVFSRNVNKCIVSNRHVC
uniref:Chitin-binding type-2 domain-containing protein n=1 Tax=Anopheles epiroticus TaxID=199890 RepID=A0A182PVS1_9DIPT